MLGQTYNVQPVPPDADHTRYFDAGVLRIGEEYRQVTPEALAATYESDDLAEIEEHWSRPSRCAWPGSSARSTSPRLAPSIPTCPS